MEQDKDSWAVVYTEDENGELVAIGRTDILVAMPGPSRFVVEMDDWCDCCGEPIRYERPMSPVPLRICVQCFMRDRRKGRRDDPWLWINEEVIEEMHRMARSKRRQGRGV